MSIIMGPSLLHCCLLAEALLLCAAKTPSSDLTKQAPAFPPSSAAIPVASLDDVEACAICMDELLIDIVSLPCGHHFHASCKTLLLESGQLHCPMCRRDFGGPTIISLIETLSEGSTEARTIVTAVLRNLTRHNANSDAIRLKGSIQALIPLVNNGSSEMRALAAEALGNLARSFRREVSMH